MEQECSERLCFTSELFDPAFALFSTEAIPTPPNSKIFSNLNKYVEGLHQSASFKSLGWFPSDILEDSPASLRSLSKSERGEQYILDNGDRLESKTGISQKEAVSVHDEEIKSLTVADVSSVDCSGAKKDICTDSEQETSNRPISLTITQKSESSMTPLHTAKEGVVNRSTKLQPLMTPDKKKIVKKVRLRLNVMERMESMKQGPLSILHNCMSKGLKLKVWTKRHAGFRGICIGYLLAFDKHFNMAMIDVDEIYTLGFESLSIEEKHHIKKRKKAAKRNRNRLNGIKKCMEEAASDEITDLMGEEPITEHLIGENMLQEQIECSNTKLQCASDTADGTLMNLSKKSFDNRIEESASLPQMHDTVPALSEHDVYFVDIMKNVGVINSTKSLECSASSLTDGTEAPEKPPVSFTCGTNSAVSSPTTDIEDRFKRDVQCNQRSEDAGNLTKASNKRWNCLEAPVIASTSKNSKSHIFRKRHINQLFIRGSNVALVGYEP